MNDLAAVTSATAGNTATVFAILASAVIVLGGLAALIRAIWKTATTLRDNTNATRVLTERLEEFTKTVDGRIERMGDRIAVLERELAVLAQERAARKGNA